MNSSSPHSHRPAAHQRLIEIMRSAIPPKGEDEIPPMPDELLRRLQEYYSAGQVRSPSTSLWSRVRQQFNSSHLALAACLLLFGVIAGVTLREGQEAKETMRGGSDKPAALTVYWLNAENTPHLPTGLGSVELLTIKTAAKLPTTGTFIVFDPAKRQARLMKNGEITASAFVDDPADSEEWHTAYTQLSTVNKR